MSLHLDPYGSTFVVFRRATSVASRTVDAPTRTELATVTGPWDVRFQPNRGAPADGAVRQPDVVDDAPPTPA